MEELTRRECLGVLASATVAAAAGLKTAQAAPDSMEVLANDLAELVQKHKLDLLPEFYAHDAELGENWLCIYTDSVRHYGVTEMTQQQRLEIQRKCKRELIAAADRWIQLHPESNWTEVTVPCTHLGPKRESDDSREIFSYIHLVCAPPVPRGMGPLGPQGPVGPAVQGS